MPYRFFSRSSLDDTLWNVVDEALSRGWLLIEARISGVSSLFSWPTAAPTFLDQDFAVLQPPAAVAGGGGDAYQVLIDKTGTPFLQHSWHRRAEGLLAAWDIGTSAPFVDSVTMTVPVSTTVAVPDKGLVLATDVELVALELDSATGDPYWHVSVGYLTSLYRDPSTKGAWTPGGPVDPWPASIVDLLTVTGECLSTLDVAEPVLLLDPSSPGIDGRTVAITTPDSIPHYPVLPAIMALSTGAEDLRGVLTSSFLSSVNPSLSLLYDRVNEVEYLKVRNWAHGPL